jgi:hypothetical protein
MEVTEVIFQTKKIAALTTHLQQRCGSLTLICREGSIIVLQKNGYKINNLRSKEEVQKSTIR